MKVTMMKTEFKGGKAKTTKLGTAKLAKIKLFSVTERRMAREFNARSIKAMARANEVEIRKLERQLEKLKNEHSAFVNALAAQKIIND